ncbi:MAG: MiaB/RimO family radical SAM methylthiotransferase [Synergistaceae bacterium]|nr:MiaB/RimO family radical SAM methylthiotransferase [Synergistaceae bacterium]
MRGLAGKTFSLLVLGCRTNFYEAEALASMLERRGAVHLSRPSEPADIVIILTCSVTSIADAKTRKFIRRARRLNASAVIAACGCSVQRLASDEAAKLGADILIGSRMKGKLPDILEERFDSRERLSLGRGTASFDREVIELRDMNIGENTDWDDLSLDRPRLRTRAFVKVQDGCGRRCSYCVVPFVRGAETSRPVADVIREVSGIVESGCGEVVITGVHLGAYKSGEVGLAGLIESLSAINGLRRLRMGSLEPFAVSGELLAALRESPIFCPHLHLPLQSGDDGILARMRRGYGADRFRRMLDGVRAALGDGVHISTDLIVGFPGETDEAFANSLDFLEEARFGKVHVFPFSGREGTDAARMSGGVRPDLIKERAARAAELSGRLLSRYASRSIGSPEEIFCEFSEAFRRRLPQDAGGGECLSVVSGWTKRYLKVYALSPGRNLEGREIITSPKSEIGGILLGEGITQEDIRVFLSERDMTF